MPEATSGPRHGLRIPVEPGEPFGRCTIDGFVALPQGGLPRLVAVCLPGGGYTAAGYYDFAVAGESGYSMVEALTAEGIAVVGLDHLGVGESTRPQPAALLGAEGLAAANHAAVLWVVDRLARGELVPGLAPLAVPVIGVGHSMGAALTMVQQANHASYDGVVLLGMTAVAGFGAEHGGEAGTPARDTAERALRAVAAEETWESGYFAPLRSRTQQLFYLDDVPANVIAADTAGATTVPRAAATDISTRGFLVPHAGRIAVPALVAFGEVDLSPDPHGEAAFYGRCDDFTLVCLPGAAHCHNMATTRHRLWRRVAAWTRLFG